MKMKNLLLVLMMVALLAGCAGKDRSGEQPFAPTVKTVGATILADGVSLQGTVLASPNSTLAACGFYCGNDTLKDTLTAATVADFSCTIDSIKAGKYYFVAFAKNGMGESLGDTLYFMLANDIVKKK